MEGKTKIQTFKDLKAWQEAHQLVLEVYRITNKYPDEEKFGLTNQSRRASISISSNVAEGFGRLSSKDKYHFYTMAKTSLAEVQNQLIVARDLEYAPKKELKEVFDRSDVVGRLIKGLMRSVSKE